MLCFEELNDTHFKINLKWLPTVGDDAGDGDVGVVLQEELAQLDLSEQVETAVGLDGQVLLHVHHVHLTQLTREKINKSMVSFVSRRYMRGENGTGPFVFSSGLCRYT